MRRIRGEATYSSRGDLHEYDITLKSLLQRQPGSGVLAGLTGLTINEWITTELPEVQTRRVDLLGRVPDGRLVHIELQSQNDPLMALRMAEYALAIYRGYGRLPVQMVLFVGQRRMRMKSELSGPDCSFRCGLTDIRDLDSEPLLASPRIEDNILAILTRVSDQRETVRRILQKIADGPAEYRSRALRELTLLAGLRDSGGIIEAESRQMPILNDIMDHDLLGPIMRQGIQIGREEGRMEGRMEGERELMSRLLTARFGQLPASVGQRLEAMTIAQIEELSGRLHDARNLNDLFGGS